MTLANLGGTIARRGTMQSNANVESTVATVKKTYKDANGNVLAADVRIANGGNDLINIRNQTTLKLAVGASVVVSYIGGSKHLREITSAADSGSISAANAETSSLQNIQTSTQSFDGLPVALTENNDVLSSGSVLTPGANIYFEKISGETTSGGTNNPVLIISSPVLVTTSLPDPTNTPLSEGTWVNLVDSYGNSLGLYRLDVVLCEWIRMDSSNGGSSGSNGQGITALSGDVSASGPGNVPATLATVNSSPGTYGDASNNITAIVNNKGLITSLVSHAISIASTAITDFSTAVNALITSAISGLLSSVSVASPLTGNGTSGSPITSPAFIAAGSSHKAGLVPDPGSTAHTPPYYLGDDGAFHAYSAASIITDYISGCTLFYSSTSVIGVNAGNAYVPSASGVVNVPSSFTATTPLANSTWYYVYLVNSSTVTISTTTPTNYLGTAYQNSSGNRYLGAFKTDSSGHIYNFIRTGNLVMYQTNVGIAPFMVLNGGAAVIPATAGVGIFDLKNTSTGVVCGIGNANIVPTSSSGVFIQDSATTCKYSITVPIASQAIQYCQNSSAASTYIYVQGYFEDR